MENNETIEQDRIATFNKLKRTYKNGSKFERFVRKVKGQAPDWKAISKYDQKDLDYLLKVRLGETHDQKMFEKGMNMTEKQLKQSRFDAFADKLGLSKSQLRTARQTEYAKTHDMTLEAVKDMEAAPGRVR